MDIEVRTRPRIFTFIGACGTGKSFMLKNIIYQMSKRGDFEFGTVFSGTAQFNGEYEWLPDGAKQNVYSEENLQKYLDKLKQWIISNPKHKIPPNFLILDDLLGKIHLNSAVFSHLMSTYRHYNLSIFITSQYMVKNVSTLLRELTNYAFIFRTRFKNSLVSLYEAFGQLCESQEEFNEMLKEATKEKHACLFYNAQKEEVDDAYLSFKVDESNVKDFKLEFEPVTF
jgi:hypothetical protein